MKLTEPGRMKRLGIISAGLIAVALTVGACGGDSSQPTVTTTGQRPASGSGPASANQADETSQTDGDSGVTQTPGATDTTADEGAGGGGGPRPPTP